MPPKSTTIRIITKGINRFLSLVTDQAVSKILVANEISAYPVGDGRVRIKGDLGLLSIAATTDAELLFKGDEETMPTHKKEA